MNHHHCCDGATRDDNDARSGLSRLRGAGEIAAWVVSSATLVLLPKCPVCLAGYLALFSSVGVSLATASYYRTSLLVMCVTALLFLAVKRFFCWLL